MDIERRSVLLRQKRWVVGDVEERVFVYAERGSGEEIVRRRRYAPNEESAWLFEKADLGGIFAVDEYDPSESDALRRGEASTRSYVIKARRP